MRLLFLDHAFHKTTGSSGFFVDLLKQHFTVDVRYLDPENPDAAAVFRETLSHDVVVLWQMDFLAPYFLAKGLPTVVVPMYDGSGSMPEQHWAAAKGARFINFSRTLHDRVARCGPQSMYVRYFPEPVPESELPDFDDLRAFFWQRRPEDIGLPTVDLMLGQLIASLHLHNAPDLPDSRAVRTGASLPNARYRITESRWFESKAKYLEALARCNVYVAPRVAEGIGFSFLEALARGMVVVASDEPTHDEYIANWVNGILFRHTQPEPFALPPSVARRLGRQAWRSVQIGRAEWLAAIDRLVDWIASAPRPRPADSPPDTSFLASLCSSYLAGGSAYAGFLVRHVLPRPSTSRTVTPTPGAAGVSEDLALLDDRSEGLTFGSGAAAVTPRRGFGKADVYSSELSAAQASFEFSVRRAVGGSRIELHGEAPRGTCIVFAVPGAGIGMAEPTDDGTFRVTLTSAGIVHGNCVAEVRILSATTRAEPSELPRVRLSRLRLLPADNA